MRGSLLLRFFGILAVISFEFRILQYRVVRRQSLGSGFFLKIVCSEKFKVQSFKIKVELVGIAHPTISKFEIQGDPLTVWKPVPLSPLRLETHKKCPAGQKKAILMAGGAGQEEPGHSPPQGEMINQ
jgi:hypothetical protein